MCTTSARWTNNPDKKSLRATKLGGRFGYFHFFLLGGGERDPEEPGGGGRFFLKIPRRGGLPGGWGRGGPKGWEGVCGEFGGGEGAKYFFGAEIPTKKISLEMLWQMNCKFRA